MATFLKPCWSSNHGLDSEEYLKKGNNLLNWEIPKVPTSKIYKTKPFTFFSDQSIKTKEVKMISCSNGNQAFNLISENPLMESVFQNKRFYDRVNVGMIQIGAKALTTKIPSNASIILCVFDTRNEKFEDSILGMAETNLSDGPLYFNVFPNITLSLFDPNLLDALSLIVIVQGFEKLPAGTSPISLMWRTCYKLQCSVLPSGLLESPQAKTVFFQTDFENSNVAVQKVTKWDDVLGKLLKLYVSFSKS